MDKEKEFEIIATLLADTGFRHRPKCPNNKSCIYCGGKIYVPCIECKQTTALIAAGYGNVKQAVKEFAEEVKKKIIECQKKYGEGVGFNDIDELFKELYDNSTCETCPDNNNAEHNERNCPNRSCRRE